MKIRVLYFILGIACAVTVYGLFLVWDSKREFRISDNLSQQTHRQVRWDDLVGKWHGKESWGNTYTITRKSDGTFIQVTDTSQSDIPAQPRVVTEKGRWTFKDSQYAIFNTESNGKPDFNRGPWITTIIADSPTEMEYCIDEGCWCDEKKE